MEVSHLSPMGAGSNWDSMPTLSTDTREKAMTKNKYRCAFNFKKDTIEFDVSVIVSANNIQEAGSMSVIALVELMHPGSNIDATESLKSIREWLY